MSFLLGALGIGKTVLGFLKSLPWQVYAILGGILALLFLWHVHTGWEKDAYNTAFNAGWNKQKVLTDAEIAKNTNNLRSIGTLQDALKAKNAESDARGKALLDAKVQDARDQADLSKRYASTAALRAQLEAISRVKGVPGQCKIPGAVASALEGL